MHELYMLRIASIVCEQDKVLLRSIAHIVKGSGGQVPEYMLKLKKATRQEKRKLAKSAVKRPAISTESLYDKEKRQKLEAMIKGSKNRKRKADQRAADRKVKQEAKKAKMESENDNQPKKKKKTPSNPVDHKSNPAKKKLKKKKMSKAQ